MSDIAALLAVFHEATGREAALWERREGSTAPTLLGASSPSFGARCAGGAIAWDVQAWSRAQGLVAYLANTGESVGWFFAERGPSDESDRLLSRLIPLVRRLAQERDGAAHELVGRYEEINLLYAISELLGGTTSVEGVAGTLLREFAMTVGATRAVFLRTNPARTALTSIATLGLGDTSYPSVSLDSTTVPVESDHCIRVRLSRRSRV